MKIEEGMESSLKLTMVLIFAFCLFSTSAWADTNNSPKEIRRTDVQSPALRPNPQREYCMLYWNKYYKDNTVDISVSTEGRYDEFVIFTCPLCSLEEHYIKLFLNTKMADGKTGANRIRECGFVKARFKGAKGTDKIEKSIDKRF